METNKDLELIKNDDFILDTNPPMTVGDALNKTDGVYFCIKNRDSVFLWVNENFANLFGKTPKDFIGKRDTQEDHVAHDKEVIASGVPLLNLNETIKIPLHDGGVNSLEIVTQKGLLREKGGTEIIGITVCFSKRFPNADSPVDEIIDKLNMEKIPLGGYFAAGPIPISDTKISSCLPERFGRQIYSMNYFLLQEGDVLGLHKLNQDEQWFFHQGSAIKLHIFSEEGEYSCLIIGSDLEQEQKLSGIAPHCHWFGAELLRPDGAELQGPDYVLVSCSLAPAWTSQDSFSPTKEEVETLKNDFPEQKKIIDLLTKKVT